MHKTYKNGIFTGNTVRANRFNAKTTRNFILVNDMKIKLNKISNTEPQIYSKKSPLLHFPNSCVIYQ